MSTDLNVISENLTELLQNSINMTSVFYDIFLNPEPMDVELKQFGFKSCFAYENIGRVKSASAISKTIVIVGDKIPNVGSIILLKGTSNIDGLYIIASVETGIGEFTVKVLQPIKTDYSPDSLEGIVGLQVGQVRSIVADIKNIVIMGSILPDVESNLFFTGIDNNNYYNVNSASFILSNLISVIVEDTESSLSDFSNSVELYSVIIPNRAKDRKIAMTGVGNPNPDLETGSVGVEASIGTIYVDIAKLNAIVVYVKTTQSGASGWEPVLTQTGVNLAIQTYLANGKYVTESYLRNNKYMTETAVVSKIDEKFTNWNPTIVMTDVTGQTNINLTDHDNQGIYLTASESVTFNLPVVIDLNILHKIFVQLNLTTGVTVTLGTTHFFENIEPTFVNAGMYNIIFEFDNAAGVWVAGATYKGRVS